MLLNLLFPSQDNFFLFIEPSLFTLLIMYHTLFLLVETCDQQFQFQLLTAVGLGLKFFTLLLQFIINLSSHFFLHPSYSFLHLPSFLPAPPYFLHIFKNDEDIHFRFYNLEYKFCNTKIYFKFYNLGNLSISHSRIKKKKV